MFTSDFPERRQAKIITQVHAVEKATIFQR